MLQSHEFLMPFVVVAAGEGIKKIKVAVRLKLFN